MRNKKGVREMEEIKKLKRLLFMQKNSFIAPNISAYCTGIIIT